MSDTPAAEPAASAPGITSRIFWFLAGSVVNYLLISTPFHWLEKHTACRTWAISACSLGISSIVLLSLELQAELPHRLPQAGRPARYIVAVLFMWGLSSVTLALPEELQRAPFLLAGALPARSRHRRDPVLPRGAEIFALSPLGLPAGEDALGFGGLRLGERPHPPAAPSLLRIHAGSLRRSRIANTRMHRPDFTE